MPAQGSLLAAGRDALAPVGGERLDVAARREPHGPQRERNITAVTDDVNEMSLGQESLDGSHVQAIERGLVSPTRLAKPGCVQLVKDPNPICNREWLDRPQRGLKRALRDLKIMPPRGLSGVTRNDLEKVFARNGSRCESGAGHEKSCFGRDGEVRMSIEHESQERRAGSRGADDDRHGCSVDHPL